MLKNIFEIPSPHKLNILRLLFWALLCLPACRQVYLFAIDESVGRLGTYAWFGLGTAVTEFLVGLKFGFLMTRPKAPWPMGKTLYVYVEGYRDQRWQSPSVVVLVKFLGGSSGCWFPLVVGRGQRRLSAAPWQAWHRCILQP